MSDYDYDESEDLSGIKPTKQPVGEGGNGSGDVEVHGVLRTGTADDGRPVRQDDSPRDAGPGESDAVSPRPVSRSKSSRRRKQSKTISSEAQAITGEPGTTDKGHGFPLPAEPDVVLAALVRYWRGGAMRSTDVQVLGRCLEEPTTWHSTPERRKWATALYTKIVEPLTPKWGRPAT